MKPPKLKVPFRKLRGATLVRESTQEINMLNVTADHVTSIGHQTEFHRNQTSGLQQTCRPREEAQRTTELIELGATSGRSPRIRRTL